MGRSEERMVGSGGRMGVSEADRHLLDDGRDRCSRDCRCSDCCHARARQMGAGCPLAFRRGEGTLLLVTQRLGGGGGAGI